MLKEAELTRTMVELTDTLIDDFDVVDLLSLLVARSVEIFEVSAAGVLLASPSGDLRVMASSSETMRLLELFELQADEGPCIDAYRTGAAIVNRRIASQDARWPHFHAEATAAGFRTVHAIPLRLRGTTIGALNMFHERTVDLTDIGVVWAQALANVATIAVLQHRATVEAKLLNEQLQRALNSRITIEQAKGMIAEHLSVNMDVAFGRLRAHARNTNGRLADVALAVIDGTLSPTDFHSR